MEVLASAGAVIFWATQPNLGRHQRSDASVSWFWQTQLPELIKQEGYRHQCEQHAENLQLALLAIDSDINSQTRGLQEEKAAKTAELAKLTALLS